MHNRISIGLFLATIVLVTSPFSAGAQSPGGVQYQLVDETMLDSQIPLDSYDSGWRPSIDHTDTSTQIVFYAGMEGSKQPQDFGVNANLGGRGSIGLSGPLVENLGIGYQLGTAFLASANAVQVFELLGASVDRTQSFTTAGVFQRLDNGFGWGFTYDFLFQDSFDNFSLGQWRIRLSQEVGATYEIGATVNMGDRLDTGFFNSTPILIEPIDHFSIYLRKYWQSGANTTLWLGQAQGHSEDNAVVGAQPRKENTVLFGAEIFAPLNDWVAIYGETNILTPVDTGAVDAYLGVEISTTRVAYALRSVRYRNFLPIASNSTFTNDLRLR